MYPQNLHTHGILVDGKDDYEDIVKKAIDIGVLVVKIVMLYAELILSCSLNPGV